MLKSTFKSKLGKKRKRYGFSDAGKFVVGGVTALLGVALLSETANAINRI